VVGPQRCGLIEGLLSCQDDRRWIEPSLFWYQSRFRPGHISKTSRCLDMNDSRSVIYSSDRGRFSM
jgi:hypothetical protein